MSRGVVDAVEHKASLIDHEMLRAIGQRLEAANEEENRKARLEKVVAVAGKDTLSLGFSSCALHEWVSF